MSKFAADTSIDADSSIAEIKKLLNKHGATKFGYVETENQLAIAFEMRDRRIRFTMPLPDPNAQEFWTGAIGSNQHGKKIAKLSPQQAASKWQQTIRQRYRALLSVIKFKLVAIEEGVATFEDEFLAHTLLPNGSTVGDWAREQINQSYLTGKMPPLLPPG